MTRRLSSFGSVALAALAISAIDCYAQGLSTSRVGEGMLFSHAFEESNSSVAGDAQLSMRPERVPSGRADHVSALLAESSGPLIETLRLAGAFSFELWLESADPNREFHLRLAPEMKPDDRKFELSTGSARTVVFLAAGASGGAAEPALEAEGAADGPLEYIVAAYDGHTLRLFRNGELVASAPRPGGLSNWSGSETPTLGSTAGESSGKATIRFVAAYSRALTAIEVRRNFTAGAQPPPLLSQVSGRVISPSGWAEVGASILISDAQANRVVARASSGPDGSFSVAVPQGSYHLLAEVQDIVVSAASFETDRKVSLHVEVPTAAAVDRDSDGLSDGIEEQGWQIRVDETGAADWFATRDVASDPDVADTDGDGLGDKFEFAFRTDPRRRDTDGDLLSDYEEFMLFKSNPADADTDGDAIDRTETGRPLIGIIPNPSLLDGAEYHFSKTSPTLADTDGDGLSDLQEILGGGFNPRRADLPEWTLEVVGDPTVSLNEKVVVGTTASRVTATLRRDTAARSRTDAYATTLTRENTQKVSASAESATRWAVPSRSPLRPSSSRAWSTNPPSR